MNPAKTPKGGRPIAASASNDSSTAYCGIPVARPLMACGSTSSPYLVRTTCQATMSPLVARPTVPTRRRTGASPFARLLRTTRGSKKTKGCHRPAGDGPGIAPML